MDSIVTTCHPKKTFIHCREATRSFGSWLMLRTFFIVSNSSELAPATDDDDDDDGDDDAAPTVVVLISW